MHGPCYNQNTNGLCLSPNYILNDIVGPRVQVGRLSIGLGGCSYHHNFKPAITILAKAEGLPYVATFQIKDYTADILAKTSMADL